MKLDLPALAGARVALVHDWFQGYHGSERVVEVMRSALAEAGGRPDVLTFHAAHDLLPPELSRSIVEESRVAALPGVRQRGHDPGRWRWLLPYMPVYFGRLDLEPYDLVISSSHACALGVRARNGALHLCYCHTPMRYAWMSEVDGERATGPRGRALGALGPWLRRVDRQASARPDVFVANSHAVRERIRRFYGREATVIHPPVDVDELEPGRSPRSGGFLWVHRLVGYKRPEVVAEAFRGLPHRLTMVGVGPLERALRARLPANVELRGWVPRRELLELYAQADGFLHLGEEDFGITMVEALAAGTPVIALDRGGARDIVRHERDGVLIDAPNLGSVRAAVEQVAERGWDRDALARRARAFSRARFVERLGSELREHLAGRADRC